VNREGWKLLPMSAPGQQRRTTRLANGTIVVLHRGWHMYAKLFPHQKPWGVRAERADIGRLIVGRHVC
jgi:hypothetical protein